MYLGFNLVKENSSWLRDKIGKGKGKGIFLLWDLMLVSTLPGYVFYVSSCIRNLLHLKSSQHALLGSFLHMLTSISNWGLSVMKLVIQLSFYSIQTRYTNAQSKYLMTKTTQGYHGYVQNDTARKTKDSSIQLNFINSQTIN